MKDSLSRETARVAYLLGLLLSPLLGQLVERLPQGLDQVLGTLGLGAKQRHGARPSVCAAGGIAPARLSGDTSLRHTRRCLSQKERTVLVFFIGFF